MIEVGFMPTADGPYIVEGQAAQVQVPGRDRPLILPRGWKAKSYPGIAIVALAEEPPIGVKVTGWTQPEGDPLVTHFVSGSTAPPLPEATEAQLKWALIAWCQEELQRRLPGSEVTREAIARLVEAE